MIIMAVKKTGISRDLIIHPGETIADVLVERGITQAELAARTGVSAAYVNNVIAGKKNISGKFAMGLEYALGVPKSFWLNLQANYEAELLEIGEELTITDEERMVREDLKDIVKYLRKKGLIPAGEKKDESILSLRKILQISNLSNLKTMVTDGAFRMPNSSAINPYVLGAWIRLCYITEENKNVTVEFDKTMVNKLITDIKSVMCKMNSDIQQDLKKVMGNYGIDFSVVHNFRGAPVQGFITQKDDGIYRMFLTIRGSFADIFWFSLFHELGHIVNGDVGRTSRFIDYGSDIEKEKQADAFARDMLLSPDSYSMFISKGDFSIRTIKEYANEQNVMPYIVIGRLQKEKYLGYGAYSEYKVRYKWAE